MMKKFIVSFFYLSEPIKEAKWKGYIYSVDDDSQYQKLYAKAKSFIENLKIKDFISIRRGKIEFRGYDSNNKPIFNQKQVDMLIGLDIAHLSYLKLVDRIIVVTYDTDLIPAIKIARINGIQVVVPYFVEYQKLNHEIQEHVDIQRRISIDEFVNRIKKQCSK